VIPREHFANAQEIAKADPNLAGELLALATQVADQEGLINGYRIVTNTGTDGGQSVGHIHFHVLGGRSLTWPPG
jgi:histidine triad (HIT) family protein